MDSGQRLINRCPALNGGVDRLAHHHASLDPERAERPFLERDGAGRANRGKEIGAEVLVEFRAVKDRQLGGLDRLRA